MIQFKEKSRKQVSKQQLLECCLLAIMSAPAVLASKSKLPKPSLAQLLIMRLLRLANV